MFQCGLKASQKGNFNWVLLEFVLKESKLQKGTVFGIGGIDSNFTEMKANIEIISFLNSINEALIEKMISFDLPFEVIHCDRSNVGSARSTHMDKELLINYINYISGQPGQN